MVNPLNGRILTGDGDIDRENEGGRTGSLSQTTRVEANYAGDQRIGGGQGGGGLQAIIAHMPAGRVGIWLSAVPAPVRAFTGGQRLNIQGV